MANSILEVVQTNGALIKIDPFQVAYIESVTLNSRTSSLERRLYFDDGSYFATATSLVDLITACTAAFSTSPRVFLLVGVSAPSVVGVALNVLKIQYACENPNGSDTRVVKVQGGKTYVTSRTLANILSDMNTAIA